MEYKRIIYDYLDSTLSFIYPRNIYCILCGDSIKKDEVYSLCPDCMNKITFIKGKTCIKCGKPLDKIYLLDKCHSCIHEEFYFVKAISCVEYDDDVKKIVYGLKYNKLRYLSFHIGEIMKDRLRCVDDIDIDVLVPIPLHRKKERLRTFNQSYLIAKYLGKFLDKPVDNKSLIRVVNTQDQNKLTREERQKNLKKAFEVKENHNIINKNILLVDDVFTTGSTVKEASRVLLGSGATSVNVVTFATGRNT